MGIFNKITTTKHTFGKFTFRRIRWTVFAILLVSLAALFFNYPAIWDKGADNVNDLVGIKMIPHFYNIPFKLGLDLQGGAHLIYQADLSNIDSSEYGDAMQGVRDVIERRVNMFGVAEPIIQINKVGSQYRLIVELAGISDVHQAIKMIGQTPYLEFREARKKEETEIILRHQESAREKIQDKIYDNFTPEEEEYFDKDPYFTPTSLTGRYLEGAQLMQNSQTYQWQVSLQFDDEGKKVFEELTKNNIGKPLAIYLDGTPISAPIVQEVISGGQAQISGNFTATEAKELVQRLNAGALPVPITLISQQTIGASLGRISLDRSLRAGIWGFVCVLLFMIFYYRLPGVVASLALLVYVVCVLTIFKLVPVTLTLAGVAGFVLSIGMAVDANILIFERLREELKTGRSLDVSVEEGFKRAWPAIRDGNISTIITCFILFFFATGPIKGFALTLGIGVILSMLSAIVVTRSFLRCLMGGKLGKLLRLWS